ncbi:radical SAM protein [Candidatus Bathyarchaeota archaeon]|nr:radical SAM protein [Candidatus Bathyarchaeota archaeon]
MNRRVLDTCPVEVGREVFEVQDPIPLIGCIAFGLIDRGTNLIQVRPSSACPLSCIFCSTNAGPKSKVRQTEYKVPMDYLVEEFERLVAFKGAHSIEAHIDTVGDPVTYPDLVELVQALSQVDGVEVVSMQTHGSILNERLLDELSEAGLTRINFSIDALDPDLARKLSDTEWYDVEKIKNLTRYVVSNTKIDLLVAPVWVPTVNDQEIPKIIEFSLSIGAGKRFPPLGIQRYEVHKHGRKVRGVRPTPWRDFYSQLKAWEEAYGVKLVLSVEDFGIHRRRMIPNPYRRFEKVKVEVVGPGWLKREKLAVTVRRDRSLTLINAEEIPVGARLRARILSTKHNILIAEPLW